MVARNGMSSLGRSIAATYPTFAAPEANQSLLDPRNMVGSSPLATVNPPVTSHADHRSGIVTRRLRLNGIRHLYSRGSQHNSGMRMMATGQVERSRFQPFMAWCWRASFNDQLFRSGGYPQNLGLSFKAPSVPDGVATSAQWGRMRAAPQFTRTVFTRRRFAGAPSVPAQPQPR